MAAPTTAFNAQRVPPARTPAAAAPSQQQQDEDELGLATQAAGPPPGAWTDTLAGTSLAQLAQATDTGGRPAAAAGGHLCLCRRAAR
jgi:hypothetical protein